MLSRHIKLKYIQRTFFSLLFEGDKLTVIPRKRNDKNQQDSNFDKYNDKTRIVDFYDLEISGLE